ncbi:DUF935 family protein [Bartonella sp. W8125]|uniref:DUF935 domain-containing protein n=1 Tax=Bartonella TaxID=773 RepID=UPI0018DD9535|nr:DUF935 family protein [Bartonella choladocola]MBI0141214.1 DUF935 family protein [Bartonella choladocola]
MTKRKNKRQTTTASQQITLSKETMRLIATVSNDITVPNYTTVLRPQDETLIAKGGGKGIRLYEEVERDGHAKSVLEKRIAKVISREWVVMPAEDDDPQAQEAAELVEYALKRFSFDRACKDALSGTLFGYSVGEIVWHVRSGLILPETIKKQRQARFAFDRDWKLRLLTPEAPFEGIELPERKFIVYRHDDDGSDPYGRGLGRILFWNVLFKREGVALWAHFLEKFAAPTPIGKYPYGTPPDEVNRLTTLLADMVQAGVIVVPIGTEVDFMEVNKSDTTSYEKWCRFWNEETSVTVLGETLSTALDGVGSRAAVEGHMEVSDGVADSDADALCETLNATIVKWIIDYNLPGAPYPTVWRPRTKNETAIEELKKKRAERQKAEMDNLQAAKQAGFVPAVGIAKTYSEIFDREMIATPIASNNEGQTDTSFAAPDNSDHPHDDHGLTALVDQLEEAAQPIFTGWIDLIKKELKKSVDAGEDLAAFAQRLLTLYPEFALTPFADVLGQAMLAADAKGRADLLEESADE